MVISLSRKTKPQSRTPGSLPNYRLGGMSGPCTTWTLAGCLSCTLPWASNAFIPHFFPSLLLEEGTHVIVTIIIKVSFNINVGTPRLCKESQK